MSSWQAGCTSETCTKKRSREGRDSLRGAQSGKASDGGLRSTVGGGREEEGSVEMQPWWGCSRWVIWICGYLQPEQIPEAGALQVCKDAALCQDRGQSTYRSQWTNLNTQLSEASVWKQRCVSLYHNCTILPYAILSTAGTTDGCSMSLWASN